MCAATNSEWSQGETVNNFGAADLMSMRLRLIFIPFLLAVHLPAAIAEDAPLQTLRGTLVPCEIDVPSTWAVRTNAGVVAAKGDGVQILLSSDPHVSDSGTAVKVACDGAKELMPDAKCTGLKAVTLAGHEWLEFIVTGTVAKQATTFLNYTHSGPAGTFTIIGQAKTEEFAKKRATLIRYMITFRFPKIAPSPAAADRERP